MLRLCYLLLGLVAAALGSCPDNFVQVGSGCYYFSYVDNRKLGWPEARDYCVSLGDDVDLAVLDYLCHDYHQVSNHILMEDIHTPMEPMYIGADGYAASWFWLDGRALSANAVYWFEKNPTEDPGCVFLHPAKPHNFKRIFLAKGTCTTARYFVCQNKLHTRR